MWICTDTYVGIYAYTFDNELVALSFQRGRKADIQYAWVSKDAALKVQDFLLTLMVDPLSDINVIDSEQKISLSSNWFKFH